MACLLAVGCTSGLDDGRHATGSSTVATSADYAVVYSVDTEAGVLAAYEVDTEIVRSIELGDQPTRVARNGDELLVTLRGQRQIVRYQDQSRTGGFIQFKQQTGDPLAGIRIQIHSECLTRAIAS